MSRCDPRPVIARVRDGQGLSAEDAALFAAALADGGVTDAQAGAFAMAVLLRGIGPDGRAALTAAMRDSGRVLRWDLPGPVVDKHSTGGIGDTVSLVLAPLLAACGAFVPMISGRGLGHTGGTLDKLEAIPGFRVDLDETAFATAVGQVGCAIVSASADLAPADRRLYAVRDESATVESLDLITASILSKKLAAGLDALVLDVKAGSGAFLREPEQAEALARALVGASNAAGCVTSALLTDMDQPLARAAGNALEVQAALDCLGGEASALRDLTLALAAECLDLVGVENGLGRATAALDSGQAAERFAAMVAQQGGPGNLLAKPGASLPAAPVILDIPAPDARVAAIDTAALGHVVVHLGGGRLQAADRIDPRVGLSDLRRIGEATEGRLGRVHAATRDAAQEAIGAVTRAYRLADTAEGPGPLVRQRFGPADG